MTDKEKEVWQLYNMLAAGLSYGLAFRTLLHVNPKALETARTLVAEIMSDYPPECLPPVDANE